MHCKACDQKGGRKDVAHPWIEQTFLSSSVDILHFHHSVCLDGGDILCFAAEDLHAGIVRRQFPTTVGAISGKQFHASIERGIIRLDLTVVCHGVVNLLLLATAEFP